MAGQTIQIKTASGKQFSAYLATPETGKGPGVVLCQEIFGVNAAMREKADFLAEEGYTVLVPDLFWRVAPNIELGYTPEDFQKAFELYQQYDENLGVEDIQDSLAFLKTRPECDTSTGLGVVGYCLGGKLAYLAGCRLSEVACAVGYYGVGIEKALDELANVKGRLVLHIAELDQFTPPDARQAIVDAANQYSNVQAYVYEGVDHAFARPKSNHYHKPSARFAHEERYAQSVDQRVKMPYWMEEFERRGGRLVIQDVGIEELEQLANDYELVLLAAGKGEVVKQFERDDVRSVFDKPQRALALTYVKNMKPISPYSRVTFNIIPEVGEYFSFPALTINGPCDIMVFEGIPNGPMDCWQDVKTPEQHLQCSLDLLKKFVPWEYERSANIELTDAGGYLAGRFPPTVRKPVLTLPSGKKIFGMADALVVNDPITGQGSNNAAKCSKIYFDAILANDNQSFSEQWIVQTFELYWAYAEQVVAWTNSLLLPPEPHVVELLAAASQNQSIASIMANNFDDPRAFAPWWFDADQAQAFLASKTAAKVA